MGIMAVQTATSILFGQFLILEMQHKTLYLGKGLRPAGDLLVTEQTGLIRVHRSHGLEIAVVDLPVTVADFAADASVGTVMPISVLFLMALPAQVRSLIEGKEGHLL